MTLFHVIGLVVTSLVGLAVILALAFYLWAKLIYQRFHWIPCRKTERRMSVASWHNTRLVGLGEDPADRRFEFDDWPIRQRPFYLSYTFGKARAFIMIGVMEDPRWNAGKGKHPEQSS